MSTNGVNGANGPKIAADFKPEELQNAGQEKVKNTIFELDEAIAADVDQMCADNEIDSTEMNRIYDWVHVIDNMIGNMSAQVKQSCSEGLKTLKDLVAELIDITGMGKYNGQNVQYDGKTVTETSQTGQTAYEPTTTDNDIAQSSGNSYDTQADIEDWIKDHYGAVPDVHKYDGVDGDLAVEQKIEQNKKDKLSGTHLTKKQIAEMEAVRRKERMEEDKKFHKSQGLDI